MLRMARGGALWADAATRPLGTRGVLAREQLGLLWYGQECRRLQERGAQGFACVVVIVCWQMCRQRGRTRLATGPGKGLGYSDTCQAACRPVAGAV